MGATLEVVQGQARQFLLRVRQGTGDVYSASGTASPFLTTDVLAARVWPGEAYATLVAPACAWVDATGDATLTATLTNAQTAALDLGVYSLQVTVTRGPATAVVFDGRLRLTPAPGTDEVPLAFTTRNDLLRYAPWLEDLQSESDSLAFAEEQARATNQLISDLCQSWRPSNLRPTLGQPGWNALSLRTTSGMSPWWLRQQLVPLEPDTAIPAAYPDRGNTAANLVDSRVSTALLLYDEVKEICARTAIGYVCQAQAGREPDTYRKLAARYAREAEARYRCCDFQVDLSDPQTGYASIAIRGGSGSMW